MVQIMTVGIFGKRGVFQLEVIQLALCHRWLLNLLSLYGIFLGGRKGNVFYMGKKNLEYKSI